jgi:glyoxylase-like metal-dependent hydrolase (beta-lactamase superfamily II)
LSLTNAYLLAGSRGYVLVDTGYATDYPALLEGLRRRRVGLAEIRVLILTHHHDDHAGAARELLSAAPWIRVLARKEAEALLASGVNSTARGGSLVNRRIAALYRLKKALNPGWDHRFPPLELRHKDLLLGDEQVDLSRELGLEAEALYTPGHSVDSMSLLLPGGELLCGDLASNFLNGAGAKYCTLFNEDIREVYASWRLVLSRGVRRLYPAHGKPFPAERLERFLDAHREETVVPFSSRCAASAQAPRR